MTWQSRSVSFKFRLSDLSFFQFNLRLKVRTISLSDEVAPVQVPAAPANEPQNEIDGFLIRGLPIVGDLPRISKVGPYLCYAALHYHHCYIDLRQSFESYQSKFSSKTKSTIKRKIRKFLEHCGGTLLWKSYSTQNEFEEFFQLARRVSSLTYQERLLDAGLPTSEDFIREAETLAAAGQMRAFILFDGERPVSYLYCPIRSDVVIYAYLGYDPDYLNFSVGTILQWLALEELFNEQRFRFFDFTEGQSAHKQLFATHQRRCANVYLLKKTFRNASLIYSHLFFDLLSSNLGTLLDRFGLKSKARRLLRFARVA